MDRNLKFILILFPIILVGAYFYGLSSEEIVGGLIIVQPSPSQLFVIDCPVGFNEITPTGIIPNEKDTVCVRNSANEELEVVLHCGDEFVTLGMVETVTCSMVVP